MTETQRRGVMHVGFTCKMKYLANLDVKTAFDVAKERLIAIISEATGLYGWIFAASLKDMSDPRRWRVSSLTKWH